MPHPGDRSAAERGGGRYTRRRPRRCRASCVCVCACACVRLARRVSSMARSAHLGGGAAPPVPRPQTAERRRARQRPLPPSIPPRPRHPPLTPPPRPPALGVLAAGRPGFRDSECVGRHVARCRQGHADVTGCDRRDWPAVISRVAAVTPIHYLVTRSSWLRYSGGRRSLAGARGDPRVLGAERQARRQTAAGSMSGPPLTPCPCPPNTQLHIHIVRFAN